MKICSLVEMKIFSAETPSQLEEVFRLQSNVNDGFLHYVSHFQSFFSRVINRSRASIVYLHVQEFDDVSTFMDFFLKNLAPGPLQKYSFLGFEANLKLINELVLMTSKSELIASRFAVI